LPLLVQAQGRGAHAALRLGHHGRLLAPHRPRRRGAGADAGDRGGEEPRGAAPGRAGGRGRHPPGRAAGAQGPDPQRLDEGPGAGAGGVLRALAAVTTVTTETSIRWDPSMRVMMMHRTEPKWERGELPSPELIAGMGALMGEMQQAGVLLAGEGLRSSSL